MQPAKINYKIYQGSTFQETFRWESETKVYVPIQTIAKSAPCVITTTVPHELPIGWRFRVAGAGGMKEINSVGDDAYYLSTAYGSDTAALEQTWLDQEAIFEDIRDSDSNASTRAWFGLTSYQAHSLIVAASAQSPSPFLTDLATKANNASQSYQAWQTQLTAEARKIEINQINSLGYTAYTNGGVVEFNQPIPLTGLAARMQIRESVDSTTVIHEATTQNNQIVLDNTNKTIQITLLANVTQDFTFSTAVYSLELYNGNNVIPFINGNISLVQEVTR